MLDRTVGEAEMRFGDKKMGNVPARWQGDRMTDVESDCSMFYPASDPDNAVDDDRIKFGQRMTT